MSRSRGGDDDRGRERRLLGRDDRSDDDDSGKLDFNPDAFGTMDAFAAPDAVDTDTAELQRFMTRTLHGLATIEANGIKLSANLADWLAKAVERDKVIATRLIDPNQLAAHAAAGAKLATETMLGTFRDENAAEAAERKALVARLDADSRARQALRDRQVRDARIAAGIGAAAALLVVAAGWVGYDKGRDAGDASGYARARDETAAVSWANTPNGKAARQLDAIGPNIIPMIANCSGQGWIKTKQNGRRVCFGGAGAVTGWFRL